MEAKCKMNLLQCFVVAFFLFNVASCWVNYDELADPNDFQSWSNNLPEDKIEEHNERHRRFYTYKSEEIAIFSKKNGENAKNVLYSCIKFNSDTHQCNSSVLKWAKLDDSRGEVDIRRIEFASILSYPNDPRYLIDILTYNAPYTTFLVQSNYLKVGFIRGIPLPPSDEPFIKHFPNVFYFEDEKDQCKNYRPKANEDLTGQNAMRTAFYYKYKGANYTTYAYFFIKNKKTICIYRLPVNNLGSSKNVFSVDSFNSIDAYPTENYAPHFFAFDQNWGAFASLFWDKIHGHPPEVHFYVFHENEPETVQKHYGYPLQNFDPDVLEEIFEGDYGPDAYPAFVAYGKQIFISFTRKGADHEFSGLWKNETEHFLAPRPLDNYQTLVRLRRDYIQVWNPLLPHDPSFKPNPVMTTTSITTTTSATTSTTSKTTTLSTTTSSPPTTTSISSTTHGMPNSTTTIDETSPPSDDDDDHFYYYDEHDASMFGKQSREKDKDDACDGNIPIWPLILFIILDILLIVLLIILIILSFVGAKKRKENAKHVTVKKSKRVPSKRGASSATTESKKSMKKKRKSEKKKKTDDPAKYFSAKDKKKKTAEQKTKFYTIDTTFDHALKKSSRRK